MRLRCPRCRLGELFPTATFSFQQPFEMHKSCPRCGLNYWPEPGYYYGAMFLSYILFSFPCLFFVAGLHWGLGVGLKKSMLILCVVGAIGFIYVFRVSRSVWLSANTRYDPDAAHRAMNKA